MKIVPADFGRHAPYMLALLNDAILHTTWIVKKRRKPPISSNRPVCKVITIKAAIYLKKSRE